MFLISEVFIFNFCQGGGGGAAKKKRDSISISSIQQASKTSQIIHRCTKLDSTYWPVNHTFTTYPTAVATCVSVER